MRCLTTILTGLMLACGAGLARAAEECPAMGAGAAMPSATQPSTRPSASLALSTSADEGKKVLSAKVTANGKAVEGATVAFFVTRTFGDLKVGEDTTLDDGTAMVPFPEGLPGGTTGQLHVMARVTAPAAYVATAADMTVDGGVAVPIDARPSFPRAIWAPRAPWALLLTFVVLLGGVWSTYIFVLLQLHKVAKYGKM